MLTNRYTKTEFEDFLGQAQWSYVPAYTDVAAWSAAKKGDADFVQHALRFADETLVADWPHLRLSTYAEFESCGNRSNYEDQYFNRRNNLSSWCVAECLERNGRFVDAIADALWSICEESSWCIPAHKTTHHQAPNRSDLDVVDLFAAETAMILATVYACLKDVLDERYPALGERIYNESMRRILEPVESGAEYWWLAGKNNWTPWCTSNCLMSAAQLWTDKKRFANFAYYLSAPIDRFIASYGNDGACDEGPGYWGKAAGAMLIYLECLYQASAGKISIYDEVKIENMGMFIAHAHLHENNFINFADAHAHMIPNCPLVYRFGERCNSAALMSFACEMSKIATERRRNLNIQRTTGSYLEASIFTLFWMGAPQQQQPFQRSLSLFLPDRDIFIARESTTTNHGFIVAAKGGHNQENHNHNDVGQFILYHNGEPLIVDVGVGTYTRDTFDPSKRYDLWPIGAQSHNPPIINGVLQQDGEEFAASDVVYTHDESRSLLLMNLKGAYASEANCDVVRREICLLREKFAQVQITDSFCSSQMIEHLEIRLVSPLKISLENNLVYFAGTAVQLGFNNELFDCVIEERQLDDPLLQRQWGEQLSVMTFKLQRSVKDLSNTFFFKNKS